MNIQRAMLAVLVVVALGCGSLKRFGYEGFDRDEWQHPDRVIAALEIAPGNRVADLGAGGGYFTFRLADAVGADGTVYAVDVDEDMIDLLGDRIEDEGRKNVETVLAPFDNPGLTDGPVDLLFTVNTYHHLEDRVRYFQGVRSDLTPEGRVAVIELNGTSWFAKWGEHFTERDVIVREMVDAGYTLVAEPDFLERQHFLVFAPARS